ncbi:MAG TPA: hypothetical protein VFG84_01665 [Gemmatimonadaceae bacterium]|nr:hypothetical protein [Gemmatimonadaceae bacterium]
MTSPLVLAALCACVATGALGAQSLPNPVAARRSAQRAVDATNAHTAKMTADQGTAARDTTAAARVAASAPRGDSTVVATPVVSQAAGTTVADSAKGLGFRREVFSYERAGRRDPFESLMHSDELRPLISDLKLVSIVYDQVGGNSVAILRDINTKEQYRAKVGQELGRMRVARIAPKSVTFTIEEFGFSRQQELLLGDSNQARNK